jgi:hypothetical protein
MMDVRLFVMAKIEGKTGYGSEADQRFAAIHLSKLVD